MGMRMFHSQSDRLLNVCVEMFPIYLLFVDPQFRLSYTILIVTNNNIIWTDFKYMGIHYRLAYSFSRMGFTVYVEDISFIE